MSEIGVAARGEERIPMTTFRSDKRVTVRGGAGFLGQHLVRRLESFGTRVFVAIGTAYSYPGYLEGHLDEDDLWAGP
jgi:nucleoside-diphosphate-sugar epimerase